MSIINRAINLRQNWCISIAAAMPPHHHVISDPSSVDSMRFTRCPPHPLRALDYNWSVPQLDRLLSRAALQWRTTNASDPLYVDPPVRALFCLRHLSCRNIYLLMKIPLESGFNRTFLLFFFCWFVLTPTYLLRSNSCSPFRNLNCACTL